MCPQKPCATEGRELHIGRFPRGFVFGSVILFAAAGFAQRDAARARTIDWPSYNNDVASDRYAAIDQIDSSNAGGLHVVCSVPLGSPQPFESGPIEIGGVVYVTTEQTTLAVDATTCRHKWTNTYASAVSSRNRGAAFEAGKIFRGYGDGHVAALNANTGRVLWNRSVIAAGSLENITAAPVAWNGLLFVGTSGGDYGQICHVMALSQTTGNVVWSAQTVPNAGTPAAQTWAGAVRIAGGGTWSSFTIDSAGNALYVPVGNPAPDYDIRKRLGLDLYTSAVLELNPQHGSLYTSWAFDPQDTHNWDQAAAPAVVRLASGEKIALNAGKDGWLRSIDLHTNKQLWQTAVTTIANANAPITAAGTHYCPGGAVLWNGPAYSSATDLAYVNSVDSCRTVYEEATPAPYIAGKAWSGAKVVGDAAPSGWLTAVDATTGTVRWRYHSTQPLLAGVTPTAGGLVLTGDLLGNILAFDAADGSIRSTIATGLPVGGGVISYAVAGKQYVAVAAGMQNPEFQPRSVTPTLLILSL